MAFKLTFGFNKYSVFPFYLNRIYWGYVEPTVSFSQKPDCVNYVSTSNMTQHSCRVTVEVICCLHVCFWLTCANIMQKSNGRICMKISPEGRAQPGLQVIKSLCFLQLRRGWRVWKGGIGNKELECAGDLKCEYLAAACAPSLSSRASILSKAKLKICPNLWLFLFLYNFNSWQTNGAQAVVLRLQCIFFIFGG